MALPYDSLVSLVLPLVSVVLSLVSLVLSLVSLVLSLVSLVPLVLSLVSLVLSLVLSLGAPTHARKGLGHAPRHPHTMCGSTAPGSVTRHANGGT